VGFVVPKLQSDPGVPGVPGVPRVPAGPWAFHVINREREGHLGEALSVTSVNVLVAELRHAEYVTLLARGVAAFAAITPPPNSIIAPSVTKPLFKSPTALLYCADRTPWPENLSWRLDDSIESYEQKGYERASSRASDDRFVRPRNLGSTSCQVCLTNVFQTRMYAVHWSDAGQLIFTNLRNHCVVGINDVCDRRELRLRDELI
jgi:hypothetical protein